MFVMSTSRFIPEELLAYLPPHTYPGDLEKLPEGGSV